MFWNFFRRDKSRVSTSTKPRKVGTLESNLGHTVPGRGADLASTDTEAK